MARVPNKHNRDQNLDFQGMLSDLQGWELSLKEKDKKLKAQSHSPGDNGKRVSMTSANQFGYSRNSDPITRISSSLLHDEESPDANSEKELGNEYFKQKKFNEAIDCYSRSIALSPSAVAYANRAMAYLKIKRFEEAENDCTEALNLDDRYIKAYSRRATARKELGKLKESIEDSEFALRLEPDNQEVKKQHADVKDLYKKEVLKKASAAAARDSTQEAKRVGVTEIQTGHTKVGGKPSDAGSGSKTARISVASGNISSKPQSYGPLEGGKTLKVNPQGVQSLDKKREQKTAVQELASRAASRVAAEAAKNLSPPKTAYQFEVSWKGLSGDPALQATFLKAISPTTLPQLFKNALSAPILIDIIKCVATLFMEETELAVKFLDNLTKVSRFDMIIMCLSAADKTDLHKMWEEVFSNTNKTEYSETLSKLQSKYCPVR
ncbi:RNA polymerase II-associated protein 3-like isoform X1 [Papaver somniferum]|uniref:RNA polymerase II-associated protein 3-like isoform X1 n=1 Tax=Papaver somniferum TaxID=3469 RepID=UPI000E70201B|nr:RNA polymerase II-associated protein 3-like isoform X1 [Papaver somniferum]